jgi:hypothetical protein
LLVGQTGVGGDRGVEEGVDDEEQAVDLGRQVPLVGVEWRDDLVDPGVLQEANGSQPRRRNYSVFLLRGRRAGQATG